MRRDSRLNRVFVPAGQGRRLRLSGHKVRLELDIFGQPFRRQVLVLDKRATLSEVVPLARYLADEIAGQTIRRARALGESVPCKKGCCACCSHLVPLSVPEVFRLSLDMAGLSPSKRRGLHRRFVAAANRLFQANRAKAFGEELPADTDDSKLLQTGAHWYETLRLECPMLAGGICAVYPFRPIACRHYFVLSSARHCRNLQSGRGRRLMMPVSVVQALCQLAAQMEKREPQAVLLPLAPFWAQENSARRERTWPARVLCERLIGIIQDQARRESACGVPAAGVAA